MHHYESQNGTRHAAAEQQFNKSQTPKASTPRSNARRSARRGGERPVVGVASRRRQEEHQQGAAARSARTVIESGIASRAKPKRPMVSAAYFRAAERVGTCTGSAAVLMQTTIMGPAEMASVKIYRAGAMTKARATQKLSQQTGTRRHYPFQNTSFKAFSVVAW